jgi:hypothetical protein
MVNNDNLDDALVNDGCPAVGAAESVCTGATDEDADGRVNDGCPQVNTLAEGSFNIGTGTLAPCHVGAVPAISPSWPSDLNSGTGSIDKITLTDLTSFLVPIRRLDTFPGHVNFNVRWDLKPGSGSANWIVLDDLTALLAGPSGNPPMNGGARVFGTSFMCTGP